MAEVTAWGVAAISSGGAVWLLAAGGVVYLLVIMLVAGLMTKVFGDAPVLVVATAVLWPWLLIPVLLAAAGYRLAGGRKREEPAMARRR